MKNSIKTSCSSISALVGALVVVGALATTTSAHASEPEVAQITVSYADLNAESEQGAKVLYARIRLAARSVCSSLDGRDLVSHLHWQFCFDTAVSSAVSQVNKPRVTALYRAQQSPKG